ncbi:MAG TPA: MoxR family ATPase [Candidatus Sulfopaludibacter sp.]|nr:MoxR family ATPase [Candidatus Sulfopaludibacter sp.]
MNLEQFQAAMDSALAGIRKVIIGQDEAIRYSLVVVLCNQHALIEGVPGLAKTLLARTLAAVLGSEFKRIQFTPDLMPADITGTNIFNLQRNEFTLVKGPLFTTFLLADEINRAPAKTQSALLEAMQERTVTIDRESHRLSPNFTVFATQNPIESEGTYPLPEAQKDRFMMKISMTWPSSEEELTLAGRSLGVDAPEAVLQRGEVAACLSEVELAGLRAALEEIQVSPELIAYAVQVVRRTRTDDSILVGAGPRATQSLLRAARAWAALSGRDFMSPDDVRAVAVPVLEHRLLLRPESELEGVRALEVLDRILHEVPVPR